MKQLLYVACMTMALLFNLIETSTATDLVVNTGGAGGTYASLNAAIAAASPGDRIIVYPSLNGASYMEGTISITKSLQILSANEGAFYTIDGNINVTPASAGMSLTIIGMKLLTGGIQSTAVAPTGARCVVNLLNDSIMTGGISFNHDNYNLTLASSHVDNGVTFRFGKILGNNMNGSVSVNTDASVNNPTDTVMVIGNKINYYTSGNAGGINWSSTSQFFSFQNNLITLSYPGNAVNFGIYVSNSKNSNTGTNTILNNTVRKTTYSIYHGYTIGTAANSITEFQNNLLMAPLYQYAFAFSGGSFNAHYNYASSFNWTGITNDGTNQAATNTTLNADGLNTNLLSNTINGGTPDSAYADINLTRNDVGCYGGSYTMDNFFPISPSDWARVILVTAPRRVMVNGAINVKATGFDK